MIDEYQETLNNGSKFSSGKHVISTKVLYGLALNTTKNKIYLVGEDAAVWLWDLDANGFPNVVVFINISRESLFISD